MFALKPTLFSSPTDFKLSFLSNEWTASSIIPHTTVIRSAIDTPAVAISLSISAVLSGSPAAVRNGNQGTISPCHKCSKARSTEPPHSKFVSHLSLRENWILSVLTASLISDSIEIFWFSFSFFFDYFCCNRSNYCFCRRYNKTSHLLSSWIKNIYTIL